MSEQSIAQQLIAKWNNYPPEKPIINEAATTNRDSILSRLQSGGVWIVDFIKVDGTQSTMEVTLEESLIPYDKRPVTEQKENPNQLHLIKAYSPDRGGWRSFVVQNVTRFSPKF